MTLDSLVNDRAWAQQQLRNSALLKSSCCMRAEVLSEVLPFALDIARNETLSDGEAHLVNGLATEAARVAVKSLASLAKINELDHLGGGLDLIPALMITLGVVDYEKVHFTIEHAHTSVGYYASLAALGYLDKQLVIDGFRRGIDIPGHVSWVPGGAELNGGRLGVMVPCAVGAALGMRARHGQDTWMLCHLGDAGWISGQALNGFNGAALHGAPVTFVMHRNGIQLSGSNRQIMNVDPRPIIEALGITIVETRTFTDPVGLYAAYREGWQLAQAGKPNLIYPTGWGLDDEKMPLSEFAKMYGIEAETAAFAEKNGVAMDTPVWVPGSLMSYRDVKCMLECVFLVNDLPGGAGHHDGHMKGRDENEVLGSPMFQEPEAQQAAMAQLGSAPKKQITTAARPAPGTPNLVLSKDALAKVELPPVGKSVSPRAGSEAGYAAVAEAYPDSVFVVSCDLDPSTKLGKARKFLPANQQFEMSIEEQASALMTNGLAVSSRQPQLNVVSTFGAFFEGIAREGFDMWRYQRNLNGVNEGVNACMHVSHVGACTGRDHFSGWSLDWINLGLSYLPYLHRFYAPADARAAFVAVKDLAAHYGGHIIGIPRDNLPVLDRADGSPLWEATDAWTPATVYRTTPGATRAILAMGAPAFLGKQAAEALGKEGIAVDVLVINGLPFEVGALEEIMEKYTDGLVTIEDGIISGPGAGLVGFAGLVKTAVNGRVATGHVGIVDPRIAPSEGHMETWEHFGITAEALVEATKAL